LQEKSRKDSKERKRRRDKTSPLGKEEGAWEKKEKEREHDN
jgi:hypothetical protein